MTIATAALWSGGENWAKVAGRESSKSARKHASGTMLRSAVGAVDEAGGASVPFELLAASSDLGCGRWAAMKR